MTRAHALQADPEPVSSSASVLTAFVESDVGGHRLSHLVDGVHCAAGPRNPDDRAVAMSASSMVVTLTALRARPPKDRAV